MKTTLSTYLQVSVMALASWMLSTQVFASVDVNGVFYELDEAAKTAVVVANPDKYTGYMTIPNDITVDDVTYSVTAIADCAFLDCHDLLTLNIEATKLTTIGFSAFERCWNVHQVTLPEGLKTIHYEAFKNCRSLQQMYFPSTMKVIGDRSLWGCTSLLVVYVPESVFYLGEEWLSDTPLKILAVNKNVPLSIKSPTFQGFDKENCVLCVQEGSKEAYQNANVWKEFPNIREVVEFGACGEDLVYTISPDKTMIVWGTGMTYLFGKFPSTTSLTNYPYEKLIIEDGMTFIRDGAFNQEKLSSITIPNSVTQIGFKPFHASQWYKDQPDGVVYAGKVLYDVKGEIMKEADVVLEDGTLGIAVSALMDHSIASLTIPSSLTNIPLLEQVIHGANLYIKSTLGDVGAFIVDAGNPIYDSRDNCNAIIETASNQMIAGGRQTTVPDGVTSIGSFVLGHLSSVTIPTSVSAIDPFAFVTDSIHTYSVILSGPVGSGTSLIESITMEGSTPPALSLLDPIKHRTELLGFDATHFSGVDTENCILYVPLGSMSDYMNADGWKDFKNIVEYDPNQGPTTIETIREQSAVSRQIFDLQGRRQNNASAHSIVIENGKKRIQW